MVFSGLTVSTMYTFEIPTSLNAILAPFTSMVDKVHRQRPAQQVPQAPCSLSPINGLYDVYIEAASSTTDIPTMNLKHDCCGVTTAAAIPSDRLAIRN